MALERVTGGFGWLGGLVAVRGYFSNTLNLIAATSAINLLSLAIPLALMQVYDRIIPHQNISTLVWLVVGAALALLLESALRIVRGIMVGWFGSRFEHVIGCEAADRILNCWIEDFEKNGLGVHLDRVNAVGTLRSFYGGQVFQAALDLPFAALFLVAIWMLAGKLALIPVAAVCLFLTTAIIARGHFKTARQKQVHMTERRFSFVIEMLSGIHFIKAQSIEEQMLRRHERLQGAGAAANVDVAHWASLPISLGSGFSQAAMFGVVCFGGIGVINGNLTMGGLAACTLLAGRSIQPIQNITNFWLRFSNAEIARSQLSEIATLRKELAQDAPPFPSDISGSIEFQNVTFGYRDDLPVVLDQMSLMVNARQSMGILGDSSSGTTTLAYLIMGALKPDSGNIFIDDFNLAEWDKSVLSGRIEYIPQNGTVFRGTIIENISMFRPSLEGQALEVADLLELDDMVALLPNGYETKVDSQSANFLPSGLIQRISIARALVVRPRIVIFDKVAAAMDSDGERVFERVVDRLSGVCTVVVISNNPRFLSRMDKVYRIQEAKLVTHKVEVTDS